MKEERKKSLYLRSCKVILDDFSILYIKEVWKGQKLLKYSYYWFTANNKLIMGWDNAHHHNELKSFPHHRHKESGVESSTEKNLEDVIEHIGKILYP